MSTRGCVAIKKGKSWVGVYNHWDSYPTGLGQDLWEHLQGKDLKQFAKELLQYGDWREYLNGGVCEYCGKKLGQPCNINGKIFGADYDPEILDNIEKTGYPDPDCMYHDHSPSESKMKPKTTDFLWIEWTYVVDTKNKTIEIYSSQEVKGKYRKINDNGYKEPLYQPVLVATVPIDGKKPDFERIEQNG